MQGVPWFSLRPRTMDWSFDASGGPHPEHELPSPSLARPVVTTLVALAALAGVVLAFAASFPVLGILLVAVVATTGWAAGVAWTDHRRFRSSMARNPGR